MPEDAARHAVGMEQVEVGQALAGRGEGDGPAHHLLDAQRGTAAGVAVELGEDDAVERQGSSWKASAVATASWPVMASMTRNV